MGDTTPRYHAAVQEKLSWFSAAHLPDPEIGAIVLMHRELAYNLANSIPGHPQLTLALQHLIECKDGAVRALVAWRREQGNPPPPNEPDLPARPDRT